MAINHTLTENIFSTTGRVLLALLFIPAGLDKIIHFHETAEHIASSGLPWADITTGFAAALEILAGLALLLGFHSRVAALALAAFTLIASYFFHAYWSVAPEQQFLTQLLFFKNIAIIGGLLNIAAQNTSIWSLDRYLSLKVSSGTPEPLHLAKPQPEALTPSQ